MNGLLTQFTQSIKKALSIDVMIIRRLIKPLFPSYHLAKSKREFESFLKSQGWGKREAARAAYEKYRGRRCPR